MKGHYYQALTDDPMVDVLADQGSLRRVVGLFGEELDTGDLPTDPAEWLESLKGGLPEPEPEPEPGPEVIVPNPPAEPGAPFDGMVKAWHRDNSSSVWTSPELTFTDSGGAVRFIAEYEASAEPLTAEALRAALDEAENEPLRPDFYEDGPEMRRALGIFPMHEGGRE